MLSDEEQAAFLDSIDRIREHSARILAADPGQEAVIGFIANLHRAVDKVAQQALERGAKLACEAGCACCCSVRVEVSAPEVFRIAHVLRGRPESEIGVLLERLRDHAAAIRNAPEGRPRVDCAFLENHRCSIYEVRPAVCRKAHSLSAERCRSFSPEIPQDLELILRTETLIRGTAEAYGRLNLDAGPFELCGAALQALTDATAEARWHAGETVFK